MLRRPSRLWAAKYPDMVVVARGLEPMAGFAFMTQSADVPHVATSHLRAACVKSQSAGACAMAAILSPTLLSFGKAVEGGACCSANVANSEADGANMRFYRTRPTKSGSAAIAAMIYALAHARAT